MHVVAVNWRPALERGRISGNRGKVAVVKPVLHSLFLLQSRPLDIIVCALGSRLALRWSQLVIPLYKPGANHEDVSDFDVAALRLRTEIDALVRGAGFEVVKGNGVRRIGIIVDVVDVRIMAIVEQNATARNTVNSPVVDAAAEVRVLTHNV